MHINNSGFQQFLLRLFLSFLLLLGGSSVVMAQFATMKISDPATNNIYWYRLKDVKRPSANGTHSYMTWTGPTSQTLASAYGMKDDNQLWCIVNEPSSGGYLLYNKAAGFSAALRRGQTKDQLMQNNGMDRGYSAFITPGVTPNGYKGEPFLPTISASGKPTEKAFALTYYRDRWYHPSSTFVGTFGKTANGGFNFNVSGQEVQIMWFESEPAGALDNTDLDYYPLINAKGTVGGLTKEAVRELERLHVQLINDFNDANAQAVKAEAARLRSTTERVQFDANKYYYVRNAHLGFFGPKEIDANSDNDVAGKGTWKKPVMYVDATTGKMKWRLSTGSEDELWQVILKSGNMASGTIQLRNKATGKYYSIYDATNGPTYTPTIRDVNTTVYPGHSQFWIQGEGFSAHAEGHQAGAGTGGNMTGYNSPDTDPADENTTSPYNYKRSTGAYLPGASVWLFEPSNVDVVTITPLTEQEKIDVRRLIWGSGKPGGITSENITNLVNLWNNGNPSNPNAVRTEFNRLLNLPVSQRVPFESGYYRIKNGHDAFNINNKTARLYENATDNQPKWKTSDTGNEAIYYLNKKGNNTYEMINISTGRYYNGAGTASVKTGQKAVEISPVNEAKYAGYFKIVSATNGAYPLDKSAHASGHRNGAGTGSGTINHKNPDGGDYAKYNFTLPNNASYPGASTWMFERVTPPNDRNHIKVKDVLNAKNVVEGFTPAQLAEFERLEDLYRAYGAGFGTAVMAEVERLVQLPKEQRIQYADGFYIIKNGSYEFYERDANKVVIMNARTDSHNVGSIGWEKKETATAGSELDEVWYVEKQADGLYTFTNLKTLTKIQGFNANGGRRNDAPSAYLAAKDMQIKLSYRPDPTYHPGQFMFQTNNGGADNDITANPQGVGNAFEQGLQSGPVLAWHGNFDHHSAWMLRKVNEKVTNLSDYQTAIKNYFLRSENRYGGFTTEALSNLKTITNPYRLVEEINKLRKDNALRVATANGYVRISSAAEAYADASKKKNVYLKYNTLATTTPAGTVANGGLAWNNADRTRVDEIWMLTKSGSSTTEHTLLSPNTKKYVRNAGGALGNAVNGNIIALDPDLFPAMFEMNFSGQTLSFLNHGLGNGTGGAMGNSRQVTDGTQSYYWAKSGTATDNINQYSTFYFEPATDLDLKVVGQFASFNYPFNIKFDAALSTDHTIGIRAYRSTKVEKDRIKVVPIEGQVVNKETPVIIETDAPTIIKLAITSEAGQDFTDNIWEGSLAPKMIETGTYILIPKDREYNGKTYPAGFYPTTVASTINPNRIYITAAKGAKPTTGRQVRSFFIEMEDDTTTGIDNLEVNEAGEKAEYYDLSGRRVVKPTKGVYLTTDGRKVYINK